MKIRTWQKFIREANQQTKKIPPHDSSDHSVKELEEAMLEYTDYCYCGHEAGDRLTFHGGIQIEFEGKEFLGADVEIPHTHAEVELLMEDLHDTLSDAEVHGAAAIKISSFGGPVIVEVQKDSSSYEKTMSGYALFLEDLRKWESGYTEIKKTTTRFFQENKFMPILTEEKGRMRQLGIYRFGCLIEYETVTGDRQRGLDDIVSDIRAIPTVTIVSVVLANERVAEKIYVAGLRIKFIPSYPGNLSQPEEAKAYILRMIKRIKNVRSVSRVTLKTDRIE